jgi:hypothetical protein
MKARRASNTIISFPLLLCLGPVLPRASPPARDPFTDLGRTVLDLSSIGFEECQKSHGFAVHSSSPSLRSMAIVFFAAALFDSRVVSRKFYRHWRSGLGFVLPLAAFFESSFGRYIGWLISVK